MLERLRVSLRIEEGEDELVEARLNDKVNDAFGFTQAFANFVAPILGAMLKEGMGITFTFDTIFTIDMAFALFIFYYNCGFEVFKENYYFIKALSKKLG